MNILKNIKIALRGITINKMRSSLTMLGITIGVGAVITMVSVGNGASLSVTSRIQSLGSNLLTIRPGSAGAGFGGARQAAGTAQTLTLQDAESIDKLPAVKEVSPEFNGSAQVVYSNKNINTQVYGVITEYQTVHNFFVAYGDFIRPEDQKNQTKVAVLGQEVVTELFESGESPLGKTIKIKNVPFKIIGIMESKGQSGLQNLDDQILIPLSTAQKRLFGENNLQTISVQIESADEMDATSNQITNLLLFRHEIDDPDEADFNIMNQADVLETLGDVSKTFTLLLGGIAGVSLLVGGIGIMNIMLVSVTERTREIGLRKAVGAKRKDILGQFLIEALTLSLFGGCMGLLVGVLGSAVLSNIGGWPFVISADSVIMAILFSASAGIFFGIYPAWKASLLNPIEALRYE